MSKFALTPPQSEAVYTRGCPILVSAAAGSGKTRVLTERLIARIAQGEDVDRFLVITFTRAAASELRGRIMTELSALSAQNPGDKRLRRQTALLYRAQIGTIDSFCGQLVRQNAHLLGISPGFAMLDGERGEAMRQKALEDVLEDAYARMDGDPGLRQLADSVGAGRDDSRLAALLLELHRRMQSRAFPESWAQTALSELSCAGVTDAGQTVWGAFLLDDAAAEARYRAECLENALSRMAQDGPLLKAYGDGFSDAAGALRAFADACGRGWDAARALLPVPFAGLRAARKPDSPDLKEQVKSVWDETKKAAGKLDAALSGASDSLLGDMRASKPALEALMGLVFALDRAFAARKRRADVCDFSDLEHFCLKLVADENGGQTELGKAVAARFAEVMVDEYQDVNAVQELLFRCVSDEGRNLFFVGDVKQAVYRFRLADPGIFNARYAAFAADENARRILLRENFRSRACVLDAVNSVFEKTMSPEFGDVAYNDEARLVTGASYPPQGERKTELRVVPLASQSEEETPDKTLAEARYVAGRIRAMVDGGETVTGADGEPRPVDFGDICVLLRTPSTSGAAYRRALLERGIPVDARQGGAFFDQPEVSFAVSLLAAADNPRQDVPLIAAMRGAAFGFTPDELTAVRAAAPGDFWTALCARADTDEKCARFAAVVNELRDLAREEPTQGVLRRLYRRTGLMELCCAMPDGQTRCANLMQLYEYARRFEQDGFRGLFRFVAWLRQLSERGEEPPARVSGGAVQLMSIHRSKGLEFPVVILADCAHGWADRGSAPVLMHEGFGLGMRLTNAALGFDWPSLSYRAIRKKQKLEELSEQLRVLYVGMTRAKERLIMTCGAKDPQALLAKLAPERPGGPVSPRLLAQATDPARWLLRAALSDGGKTIDLAVAEAAEAQPRPAEAPEAPPQAEPALVRKLEERLAWVYPFADAVALPSKLTATEAAKLSGSDDPEARPLLPAREKIFRLPELSRGDRPLTGAERGTAAHLVMQHVELALAQTEDGVRAELARLTAQGFLDARQAAAVEPGDILAFFRSGIGRRVLAARRVVREFRFSLLCPAVLWFPGAPEGERVLLQGAVDLYMEEDGGLTVVDFKTDAAVEPERYAGQLRAYAYALARITGKPVRQAVLWYLRAKTEKTLALEENL